MTELLSDPDSSVRVAAIKAVGDMEITSVPIVTALTDSLGLAPMKNVLLAALPSLSTLGAKSEITSAQLSKVLQDQRSTVRAAALKCMTEVESDQWESYFNPHQSTRRF